MLSFQQIFGLDYFPINLMITCSKSGGFLWVVGRKLVNNVISPRVAIQNQGGRWIFWTQNGCEEMSSKHHRVASKEISYALIHFWWNNTLLTYAHHSHNFSHQAWEQCLSDMRTGILLALEDINRCRVHCFEHKHENLMTDKRTWLTIISLTR